MKKFNFALMTIMIAAMEVVMSQPSLPVNPPQAPIDGGLGLLAVAGGAYAYKKLKGKKNEEEEIE